MAFKLEAVVHATDCDMGEDCSCGANERAMRQPRRVEFTVVGVSQPQGSTKAFIRPGMKFPVVTSDNAKLKGWRAQVAWAASKEARRHGLIDRAVPVRLMAAYFLARPKSLGKKVGVPHVTKPDIDKLTRAIGDALTGILYADDSQITELKVTKAYAAVGEAPHVVIVVQPLTVSQPK
jgi:crossover junction endodeoxyribonuclease RusA